ncbi:MAG: DUF2905 domain-containing protein [Candidatus Omnitrophica bacterium]|nr:DUF2905 domain-containing protein [Candidatus Omnitrophota bacterium]
MNEMSRILIGAGVVLVITGVMAGLFSKFSGIGKLPGDLVIRRGDFSFYFPVVTCLVMSVLLTFLLNFFGRK